MKTTTTATCSDAAHEDVSQSTTAAEEG
jgi:hypothetical protein